jgi:hypothetical protein
MGLLLGLLRLAGMPRAEPWLLLPLLTGLELKILRGSGDLLGGLRLMLFLLGGSGLGLGLGLGLTLRGGLLLLDRLVTGLGLLLNGVCLGLMLMLLLMDC